MSGQPAARQGDAVKGSKIIQGSRTVFIGSQGGVACSECPGGVAKGSPVSVSLGAKVLSGSIDLDFALPGAMPLAWQRQYSSYVNAEYGGACGVLGYGWKSPLELQLLMVGDQAQLFDTAGRVITFEDGLLPGTSQHSASEDIWLLRGGRIGDVSATQPPAAKAPSTSSSSSTSSASTILFSSPGLQIGTRPGAHTLIGAFTPEVQEDGAASHVIHRIEASDAAHWLAQAQWQHIPGDWAANPHCIIATNGNGQVLWCFEPETALTSTPSHNAQRWLLTSKRDRLGRQQKLHYASSLPETQRRVLDAQGQQSDTELPAHWLVAVEDGLGRYYQLHYQCSSASAAAAWHKRFHERLKALAKGQEPPAWDISSGHQGQAGWQMDSGIRLARITLERNAPSTQPIPLIRYSYNSAGDLIAVYDRSGTLVREFAYAKHLMVAHRHRQGPWHRYVYEGQDGQPAHTHSTSTALPGARVVLHTNEQGLNWQ